MKPLKTLRLCIIILATIVITDQANAQFGDVFKKRIKRTAEDKSIQKSEELIERGIDEVGNALWKKITNPKKKKAKYRNNDSDGGNYSDDGGAYGDAGYDDAGYEDTGYDENEEMNDMENTTPDDTDAMSEKIMNMLGGRGETVNTEAVYSFDTQVEYKINVTDDKNRDMAMNTIYFYNPQTGYSATKIKSINMDGQKSRLPMGMTNIIDANNGAMIMIMEEQKMAQIMPVNVMEDINPGGVAGEKDVKISKTGNKKNILGYKCEEYKISSPDMAGVIWIAPQFNTFGSDFLRTLGDKVWENNDFPADIKGMMMEADMVMKDKKSSGKKMKMRVVNIGNNQMEIVMGDYKRFSMDSRMFKGK